MSRAVRIAPLPPLKGFEKRRNSQTSYTTKIYEEGQYMEASDPGYASAASGSSSTPPWGTVNAPATDPLSRSLQQSSAESPGLDSSDIVSISGKSRTCDNSYIYGSFAADHSLSCQSLAFAVLGVCNSRGSREIARF